MQEQRSWHPPTGALGRLTTAAYARADALQSRRPELEGLMARQWPVASLADALAARREVAVIAEIKRRSPSKGAINEGLDAPARAALYAAAGASGISVLTEPVEFGGSTDDLGRIAAGGLVPLLKKDFHVDGIQLLEARAYGASAALLIARALAPDHLVALALEALRLGVEPLIEVRSEAELEVALSTPARMIGVNARDLESLVVEPQVVQRLLPRIPADRLAIAESGVTCRADVEGVATVGAAAVLVGSALSVAADPAALLRDLASVPRRA